MPDGLSFLDHTADVGIVVDAGSLDALFHRAALGMLALLRGEDDDRLGPTAAAATRSRSRGDESVEIALSGAGLAELLAGWLRELLFLHETKQRDYVGSEFQRLDATALRARVRTEPGRGAVREIKGVTYHELAVERAGSGWSAQVIFDV